MDLENTCNHCSSKFEEGNLALKTDNGYVHHYSDIGDLSGLQKLTVCDAQYSGKVCVYHNSRFYDLERHSEHLNGINVGVDVVQNSNGNPLGQTVVGDLSFFDNLEAED